MKKEKIEIGSEFCTEHKIMSNKISNKYFNAFKKYNYFCLSGRTAIDIVINDIKNKLKKTKLSVYLPSYCCESIIRPFIDNEVKLYFYEVNIYNGEIIYNIDKNINCDIFYAMNYFGFLNNNIEEYLQFYKNKSLIIEDITHSFLSSVKYSNCSTYLICSLRKWLDIYSGAFISSNIQINNILNNKSTNIHYLKHKQRAMNDKSKYLNNELENKEYLNDFKKANIILNDMYKNYNIDKYSIDIINKTNFHNMALKRKVNAALIESFLKDINIKPLFKYNTYDVPLVYPIYIEKQKIIEVRYKLCERNIYLPIHWPKSNYINSIYNNTLYENELSLICDQRYNEKDIINYLKILGEIYEQC